MTVGDVECDVVIIGEDFNGSEVDKMIGVMIGMMDIMIDVMNGVNSPCGRVGEDLMFS